MIEAEGPDGVVHEFPEGTEEKVIRSVLAKHYGWDGATPNSVGPKEIQTSDKYRAAAVQKADKLDKMGLMDAGVGQRLFQGMTLGAGDEAQAILDTPIAMIEQGTFNPIEGYKYSKEFQNERLNRSKKNTGFAGDVAELAGGIATGANAARNGLTFLKQGQNLGGRMLSAAKEGAAYGGITGAATNEGEDRISGAAKGAAIGAGVGAAIPAVGAGLAFTPAAPVASNIMSMVNPERAAQARLARALMESGRSADDVLMDMSNAQAAGQGEYALADALGNPGQRLLSTVARAPGKGQTDVVDFLKQRQSGQADRVGTIVDEALGADKTGRQASDALRRQAQENARPLYQAANDYPIQWTKDTEAFLNDPIAKQALNQGIETQRLESLARDPANHNPADFTIEGFNKAASQPGVQAAGPNMRVLNAIKIGLDDMLEKYRDPTTNRLVLDSQGHAIDQVRRSYIKHLDDINPRYQEARQAYAGPAAEREAIERGKMSYTRGRAEDNIGEFNRLSEPERRGFRVGYADKLNEGIERGRETYDAAGKLTPIKTVREMDAMTLDQGPLRPGEVPEYRRRLEREQTMFKTRDQAIGGSRTTNNTADQAENQIDPRVFTNLLSGNFTEAARNAARGAGNVWGGNTPRVREYLAQMLLQRGDAPNIRTIVQDLENRGIATDARTRALSRALLTGSTEYANQKAAN